jgi:hypothetical protein
MFRPLQERLEEVREHPGHLVLPVGTALDTDYPAVLRAFQAFNDAILQRICGGEESGGPVRVLQTVLVIAVYLEKASHAEDSRQLGAGGQVYGVINAGGTLFVFLGAVLRDIRHEAASKSHVQELHAPADPQYGQVPLQGQADQRKMVAVQALVRTIRSVGCRGYAFAIGVGRNPGAIGDD